jgi:drug/metabolite transporter (DMT)-like permease
MSIALYIGITSSMVACSLNGFEMAYRKLRVENERCEPPGTTDQHSRGVTYLLRFSGLTLDTISAVCVPVVFIGSMNAMGLVFYIVYNRVVFNERVRVLRWIGMGMVIVACGIIATFVIHQTSNTPQSIESLYSEMESASGLPLSLGIIATIAAVLMVCARIGRTCDAGPIPQAAAYSMLVGCMQSFLIISVRHIGLLVMLPSSDLHGLTLQWVLWMLGLSSLAFINAALREGTLKVALCHGSGILAGAGRELMLITSTVAIYLVANHSRMDHQVLVLSAITSVTAICGMGIIMYAEPRLPMCLQIPLPQLLR